MKHSKKQEDNNVVVLVESPLGWFALLGCGPALKQLTFGHPTRQAALAALDPKLLEGSTPGTWNKDLVKRIQNYAAGQPTDFRDVPIDLGALSAFQRRVVEHCRQIPYGKTLSYGELAAKAGSPRAARAVGNCMAANRFPLIVPCHRVVAAGGRVGSFSAPGGSTMKKRLLAIEAETQTR